jgi:DNA-binding response OmpR family regulator
VLASEAGNWSQAWQHRAYQAAHKLAGSLGLFGLSEGTKICQSLEAELQQNIKSSTIGTASPNFSSLVAQLHQAIDTALVTSSHASTEVRKYAPRTEALLPELLVISDSASWLSEATEIAANKTYRISATSRHEAHSHINQGSSNVIVLDMTAEELWQDYLVFLADFAKQDAVISVIAITQADDFETRLAITRCSRKCICLPKSTDLQLILDYAVERSRQQKISNLHIIAVDDDPSILTAIEDQLKFQGIKVTTLGNPNHLWDKLSMIDSPDVILLDFEMPNVNGIELCQVIRSDRRWQELPILFLSACRDADIVQQMYQAGADGYIAKPFIVSDLITCIRHCIGRHHPPQI